MSQALTTSSPSNSDESVGMSDEEELKRVAAAYNEAQGAGEVLLDISEELKELGIERV